MQRRLLLRKWSLPIFLALGPETLRFGQVRARLHAATLAPPLPRQHDQAAPADTVVGSSASFPPPQVWGVHETWSTPVPGEGSRAWAGT